MYTFYAIKNTFHLLFINEVFLHMCVFSDRVFYTVLHCLNISCVQRYFENHAKWISTLFYLLIHLNKWVYIYTIFLKKVYYNLISFIFIYFYCDIKEDLWNSIEFPSNFHRNDILLHGRLFDRPRWLQVTDLNFFPQILAVI